MRKIQRWTRQDSKREKKGEVKERDKKRTRGKESEGGTKGEDTVAGTEEVKGHQQHFFYITF